MTEYLFKIAREYELAFACERADLAHDEAALSHAHTIAARHPQAATVTVAIESRTVGRVSVHSGAPPDSATLQTVTASRDLIASARKLLAETECFWGPKPPLQSEARGGAEGRSLAPARPAVPFP